jgi:hypothetical protein
LLEGLSRMSTSAAVGALGLLRKSEGAPPAEGT